MPVQGYSCRRFSALTRFLHLRFPVCRRRIRKLRQRLGIAITENLEPPNVFDVTRAADGRLLFFFGRSGRYRASRYCYRQTKMMGQDRLSGLAMVSGSEKFSLLTVFPFSARRYRSIHGAFPLPKKKCRKNGACGRLCAIYTGKKGRKCSNKKAARWLLFYWMESAAV